MSLGPQAESPTSKNFRDVSVLPIVGGGGGGGETDGYRALGGGTGTVTSTQDVREGMQRTRV